jgi:hypothetical protein
MNFSSKTSHLVANSSKPIQKPSALQQLRLAAFEPQAFGTLEVSSDFDWESVCILNFRKKLPLAQFP